MDFEYIDREFCIPKDKDHVNHPLVFRRIKQIEFNKEDFYPTCKKKQTQIIDVLNEIDICGKYSTSLYNNLTSLVKKFRTNRKIYVAVGKTSLAYGISHSADFDNHIDYFLYSPEDKSPFMDFSYYGTIIVKEYLEEHEDA